MPAHPKPCLATPTVVVFCAALLSLAPDLVAQAPAPSRTGLEERIRQLSAELEDTQTALAELDAGGAAGAELDRAASDEFFRDHVAPLLQSNCWACHGPLRQRGGLRLDSRQAALNGGDTGAAIVPGDAAASLMIEAVLRRGDLQMPPPRALAPEQIEVLEAWIDAGAPWPAAAAPAEAPIAVAAREVPRVDRALDPGAPISFNTHIRPILSDHCYTCHGPDAGSREAGLRLDRETDAFAELPSGRRALVPGELTASQLFQRVAAVDPDHRMPPRHHMKQLDAKQVDLLGRWILQGAHWQPHWSFLPPRRPTPPTLATETLDTETRDTEVAGEIGNEIDRFVLARLEREGLAPSGEAERTTLIRRLSLDLTGLAPTPEEVDAFLADSRSDAYERLVDRLLDSPRYGEHMARYWLDAARFADTNGYHIDNQRDMWRWRDWVIGAFNRNQPFDQFTLEQIAGDLLPEPTFEQRIATGFNRNHMVNFEGGAIPEEYRVQYVFDRTDTTATVWLGLTAGCAKCHDHKFDPLTQREYYQLAAFFNSIEEEGLDGYTGNAKPVMPAPTPAQREEEEALLEQLAPLYRLLDEPNDEVDRAQHVWRAQERERLAERWHTLRPIETTSEGGATFTTLADDSTLVSGENPDTDVIEVIAQAPLGAITALRLEALRDPSLPREGIGRSSESGSFYLTELEVQIARPGQPFGSETIEMAHAFADHRHPSTPVVGVIDDDETTGWAADFAGSEGKRTAVFLAREPFGFEEGTRLRIRLSHESVYPQQVVGRFRLAVTEDPTRSLSTLGQWWLQGPFVSGSPLPALDSRPPPIDLEVAYPDGRRKWSRLSPETSDDSARAWERIFLDNGVSYLYREITAPSPRTAEIDLRGDAFRLWRNGELIDDCPGAAEGAEPDSPPRNCRRALVEIPLIEGRNELLIAVQQDPEDPLAPADDRRFRFRRASETVGRLDFGLEALLATADDQLTEEQFDELRRYYRRHHWGGFATHEERFAELESELEALREAIPTSMVMAEREEPRPAFVLSRGEYDKKGEQVQAATPSFLPPIVSDTQLTRLDFARWLVDPENPLTARVTVNRLWQRFFGNGLVSTVEDFGAQGALPSHPALLDWLATELIRTGWDLKAMQRLIVTSATYRQSSRLRPDLAERDPENILLARAARFRIDAEMVRDNALLAGGLLVETLGGPSVKPYQPAGLWREIGYESNGRFSAGAFVQDEGDDLYRRSLYTFWKRTVPPPNMLVFDAPNRETCTVRRARSNTPLQALVLLNDPQFVEAARALAQRMLSEVDGDATERIDFAFRTATSRSPTAQERRALEDLWHDQLAHYRSAPESAEALIEVGDSLAPRELDPIALAAWSTVASVVLNLDETLTRP